METKFNKRLEEQGQEGWQEARELLKRKGWDVFQIDWMGKKDGEYVLFEVKKKSEPFNPPPFYGHGLEIRQVKARLEFQQITNIKTYLLIFGTIGKVYGQYLDKLEKGESYITKNGIKIYPLENFELVGVMSGGVMVWVDGEVLKMRG